MDKLGDDGRARALVAEVLAGRREAFAELVGMFQLPVYNLALRMTGGSEDQAADLAQDIFTRAWLRLASYDRQRPFFTWLYTLALNVIRNHLAHNRRLPPAWGSEPDLRADERPGANPPDALQRQGEHEVLLAALQQLPPAQREVLLLRYYQDLSYPDLAVVLEISESAAKMRAARGMEVLRRLMTGGGN